MLRYLFHHAWFFEEVCGAGDDDELLFAGQEFVTV